LSPDDPDPFREGETLIVKSLSAPCRVQRIEKRGLQTLVWALVETTAPPRDALNHAGNVWLICRDPGAFDRRRSSCLLNPAEAPAAEPPQPQPTAQTDRALP